MEELVLSVFIQIFPDKQIIIKIANLMIIKKRNRGLPFSENKM